MAAAGRSRGQTEFNMPVKETVKSVNNNQLLRTYDTEDSFTRRRDSESLIELFLSRLSINKCDVFYPRTRESLRAYSSCISYVNAINHDDGRISRARDTAKNIWGLRRVNVRI